MPFVLSEEGAIVFQKAAIDAGATKNPDAHPISMHLDKDEIFSAPLAAELAGSLEKVPVRTLEARVGTGDAGSEKAKELYIHLREGALPVNVAIVGSGQVSAALGKQFKVQMVIAADTVDETKKVLDSKLNRLGLQDIRVRVVDNKYILIDLAGMDVATAQDIVGKPGKFEIRIQTDNNQTIHVLYGDAVESVDIPKGDRSGGWGVPFTLSEEGAAVFQKAAIDAGAVKNPDSHPISMYLDKDEIFSAPLAAELAGSLEKVPVRSLEARVGAGDAGSTKAKELYIHLREGALPVNVAIVGSGQVSAALGKQFKIQMVIAGLIALLAVALMVFYRYRERRVVLPMVATSFSEVVMMLGIWSLGGIWFRQLDLASLAGIIMVIGTGVDQLVIITDELIRGSEAVPVASDRSIKERAAEAAEKSGVGKAVATSSKVYLGRLSRAFTIILGAAATTAFAMVPLLYMGFGALTGFALIIIIGVVLGTAIARPAYGRIIGHILAGN